MIEDEMQEKGFAYLAKQKQYKIVKQEIPFLSRCIDVVLINKKNELITIEFKVSKWRHAIEQAYNHRLGADKSYICLPKRRVTNILRQALEEKGIGLFLYDENNKKIISEIIPPPQIPGNVPIFKKILLEKIGEIN